jgi:hypothetical protein
LSIFIDGLLYSCWIALRLRPNDVWRNLDAALQRACQ